MRWRLGCGRLAHRKGVKGMFHIYAVVIDRNTGEKHRHHLGTEEDEFIAKHRANVATCSFASYAYVKDTRGGTIFFIQAPDYETELPPVSQVLPLRQAP